MNVQTVTPNWNQQIKADMKKNNLLKTQSRTERCISWTRASVSTQSSRTAASARDYSLKRKTMVHLCSTSFLLLSSLNLFKIYISEQKIDLQPDPLIPFFVGLKYKWVMWLKLNLLISKIILRIWLIVDTKNCIMRKKRNLNSLSPSDELSS